MPMINFSEPIHLIIGLIVFLLVLWLAKQSKRSIIVGLMLFIFLTILGGHAFEFASGMELTPQEVSAVTRSIIFDLVFIFLAFISYLWIDDVEAKFRKKKSVDNSLDWFWGKV